MNDLMMDRPIKKAPVWTNEDNEKYCESPEWKNLVKKAKKDILKSYTVIYREPSGELKEGWHHICEDDVPQIQAKYKDIVLFCEKKLPFGDYLKMIHGGSKK